MAKERILIIDDDPDITKAVSAVLKSQDYNVLSAGDETEGMQAIKTQKPDLIILDVMMNRSDEGFCMARSLRKNPHYKDIPLLMFTAVKQKTGLDFQAEAGDPEWLPVDAFLDKPVEPELLLAKVKSLLEKKEVE